MAAALMSLGSLSCAGVWGFQDLSLSDASVDGGAEVDGGTGTDGASCKPLDVKKLASGGCPAGYATCGVMCRITCATDADCCLPADAGVRCSGGFCLGPGAQACAAGQVCAPGQTQCDGSGVQLCDSTTGQWGATVPCANSICSMGACTGACSSGHVQCSGNTVQTCNGGTWTNATNCTTQNQTCGNGSCIGVCAPYQAECQGNMAYSCTSNGTWGNTGDCTASGQTCVGGACTGACASGQARCPPSTGACCATALTPSQGIVGGCCVLDASTSAPCQTQHNNGTGGYYYDCVSAGTYDQTQAMEAALSDTAQAGSTMASFCGSSPNIQYAIMKTAGNGSTGTCTTWVYQASGTYNGVNLAQTVGTTYVSSGSSSDMGCFCSMLTSANWN